MGRFLERTGAYQAPQDMGGTGRQARNEGQILDLLRLRRPDTTITPALLLEDNRTPRARAGIRNWQDTFTNGILSRRRCGDARSGVHNPNGNYMDMRSIAVGGFDEVAVEAIGGSVGGVVEGHFTGSLKERQGCGGQMGRAQMDAIMDSIPLTATSLSEYLPVHIARRIVSPDTVVQVVNRALRDAKLTGRPQLATLRNVDTLEVIPIAEFNSYGAVLNTSIPGIEALLMSNPRRYDGPIVPLQPDQLNLPSFRRYVREENDAAETYRRDLRSQGLRLEEVQRTQDPRVMVLSTDVCPIERTFPLLSNPNTAFTINVPIDLAALGPVPLEGALAQIEYPIHESVESNHSGRTGGPFRNTDTFVVLTSNLNASREIAALSLTLPSMREWLALPGRHILVGESRLGEVSAMEEFFQAAPPSTSHGRKHIH